MTPLIRMIPLPKSFTEWAGLVFGVLSIFTLSANAQWDAKAADQAFAKTDARLNAVYREVLGKIKRPAGRADFIAAQRAWIEFRDAEASSVASVTTHGGIVWTATETDERTRLTIERTQRLKLLGERL